MSHPINLHFRTHILTDQTRRSSWQRNCPALRLGLANTVSIILSINCLPNNKKTPYVIDRGRNQNVYQLIDCGMVSDLHYVYNISYCAVSS